MLGAAMAFTWLKLIKWREVVDRDAGAKYRRDDPCCLKLEGFERVFDCFKVIGLINVSVNVSHRIGYWKCAYDMKY